MACHCEAPQARGNLGGEITSLALAMTALVQER
jgi:hypothetical protein